MIAVGRIFGREALIGKGDKDDEDPASRRDVKRVDILKMHAYRDAIKRTGGA